MANPNKAKGTKWESDVREYLKAHGFPGCVRIAQTGALDCGDLGGVPDWTLQCKNANSADWSGWLNQTEAQTRNSDTEYGLLVVKRRLQPVGKAYAVMTLEQAVDVMLDVEEARRRA